MIRPNGVPYNRLVGQGPPTGRFGEFPEAAQEIMDDGHKTSHLWNMDRHGRICVRLGGLLISILYLFLFGFLFINVSPLTSMTTYQNYPNFVVVNNVSTPGTTPNPVAVVIQGLLYVPIVAGALMYLVYFGFIMFRSEESATEEDLVDQKRLKTLAENTGTGPAVSPYPGVDPMLYYKSVITFAFHAPVLLVTLGIKDFTAVFLFSVVCVALLTVLFKYNVMISWIGSMAESRTGGNFIKNMIHLSEFIWIPGILYSTFLCICIWTVVLIPYQRVQTAGGVGMPILLSVAMWFFLLHLFFSWAWTFVGAMFPMSKMAASGGWMAEDAYCSKVFWALTPHFFLWLYEGVFVGCVMGQYKGIGVSI